MANKKQVKKTAGTKSGKNAKSQPAPTATAAGAGIAFLMGLASLAAFVCLFLPLYREKDDVVRALDFMLRPSALPAAITENFNLFPGPLLFTLLAATALTKIGVGFAWPRLNAAARRWVANSFVIVSGGAILWGLVLLLGLLDMNVIANTELAGIWAAALFIFSGLCGVRVCAFVDSAEGRTDAALSPGDWAIWLVGLTVTAIFHYTYVCYSLVVKAPNALTTKLRTFR